MTSKIITTLSTLLALVFLMSQCNTSNTSSPQKDTKDENTLALGKEYTAQLCNACHGASGSEGNRLAPPMIAVRDHYLETFEKEEDFIKAFTAFVLHPDTQKTQMPGAIRKFGLMPKMVYSEDKIIAIATYLYHEAPEKPQWYDQHRKAEKGSSAQQSESEDPYFKMAMATKKQLGKNLMNAMQTLGAAGAVDFCNTRALPITDSMSTVLNAHIRRVSDKPRNVLNQANEEEQLILTQFKKQMAKSGTTQPTSAEANGKKRYYYAIDTQAMCLNCHGTVGQEVKSETWAVIEKKYPNDKATGYQENQIRGMWVVEVEL